MGSGGWDSNLISTHTYHCLMNSEHCLLLMETRSAGRPTRAILGDRERHSFELKKMERQVQFQQAGQNIIVCAHNIGVRIYGVRALPIADIADAASAFGIWSKNKQRSTHSEDARMREGRALQCAHNVLQSGLNEVTDDCIHYYIN